ncbi:MAG TPA: hypothetical protein VFR33_12440 [Candidatus Dormibacteraeota bacterium]|nr:hypothetical protein [Candidatus Dormibacteraeota bacterium]
MGRLSRKRLALLSLVLAALAALVLGGTTASANGGKLRCFADAPASCTLNSGTGATIDTTSGGDAGVYLSNGKSTGGFPLANVSFSFTYFCQNTLDLTSCIGGGAPRWSIPISTDGSGTTAGYAFLDAQGCLNGGTQPSGGALTVSTAASTCPVNAFGIDYPNWAAFAAANPSFTIASALPFVISDVATGGEIIVSDLDVTKS